MPEQLTPQEEMVLAYLKHHYKRATSRGADGYASRLFLQNSISEMEGVADKDELKRAAQGLARKMLAEYWTDPSGMTHWKPTSAGFAWSSHE